MSVNEELGPQLGRNLLLCWVDKPGWARCRSGGSGRVSLRTSLGIAQDVVWLRNVGERHAVAR